MLTIDFSRLDPGPGSAMLDLGCGEGRHIHNFFQNQDLRAVALDLNFEAAKKTLDGFRLFFPKEQENGYLVLEGSCVFLPFSKHFFEAVVCAEVLEHLENYHQALLEIHRVLKPGGKLGLSVPRYLPERICWYLSKDYQHDPGGHVRIFKSGPLILEIERLGFKLMHKHYAHGLHAPYWWLKCLKWEKRDFWAPIRLYHRFLVWDIEKKPRFTRILERILNPFIGKSTVLYFKKVE